MIKKRTGEIAIKNKTLLEISVLNAHSLREPLSRVIGLVNLLNDEQFEELVKQVILRIKVSSNNLDAPLQNVINRTTKELSELKA